MSTGLALQRKCACSGSGHQCATCAAKKSLQRKSRPGAGDLTSVPPVVNEVLASPGRPLDAATRAAMEAAFDRNFAHVRIHDGTRAAASADAVDARAYTVGRNVVFGEGQFSTESTRGRELLAHELAHVVQQESLGGAVGGPSAALESQADAAAREVSAGRAAPAMAAAPVALARKPKNKTAEVPQRLALATGPGTVSVTYEGSPILTVTYDAAKGDALASVTRDAGTGMEGVNIVLPPGSNPARNLDPKYNELFAAGKLTLNEYEDGYEFYLLASPIKEAPKATETEPPPEQKATTAPPGPAPPPKEEEKKEEDEKKEEEKKEEPEQLPEKSADQMISEHTSYNFLNEDGLGLEILKYARSGDTAAAQAVLTRLGSTDRDDVARAFVEQASEDDLVKLAGTPEGKRLLTRLLDELTAGYQGDDERQAADRIKNALLQSKAPEQLIAEAQRAPVIPFSGVGFTKFSSASIDATILDNGKIRIKSFMKQEHWQHAKRVSTQFRVGIDTLELEPDALVGIYNIDEGGKTVYVPAAALLQMSNQEDTKLGMMGGEAFVTGLTLGSGGLVVAGGEAAAARGGVWTVRALTALKWGDRIATGVGVASTLINDHRGLIISKYGKSGEEFLKQWQIVETVLAVYSVGRGAVALGQTAASLRNTIKDMRARKAALGLTADDEKALDKLIHQTEQTLDEIENAAPQAKTGTTGAKATGAAPHGDVDEPGKVLASKSVEGGHHVDITPEGAKLCSPPPCPLLRVQYARELKDSPDLAKELTEIEALRRTNPGDAASRAADLQKRLAAQRRASFGGSGGPGRKVPDDVIDEIIAEIDNLEDTATLDVGQKRAAQLRSGEKNLTDTPITFDIDEPFAVGAPGIKTQHARRRATDPHNRQLLDPNTNRITKHVRTSPEDIARARQKLAPVSVTKDPAAIFTRRFDEVVELQQVFNDAVAKIKNRRALKPTALKNEINKNIRDIIQNGRTPEGRAIRDALKAQGFEFREGLGIVALRQ